MRKHSSSTRLARKAGMNVSEGRNTRGAVRGTLNGCVFLFEKKFRPDYWAAYSKKIGGKNGR